MILPLFIIGIVTLGGVFLLALVIILIFRLARGAQVSRELDSNEGQMLQETWRQMERFDERLTNLETILIARSAPRTEERPRGAGK